jgi:hypothetical protein
MDTKKITEIHDTISSVAQKIKEIPKEDFSRIFDEEITKVVSERSEVSSEKVKSGKSEPRTDEGKSVRLDDIMLFIEGIESRKIVYESDVENESESRSESGTEK